LQKVREAEREPAKYKNAKDRGRTSSTLVKRDEYGNVHRDVGVLAKRSLRVERKRSAAKAYRPNDRIRVRNQRRPRTAWPAKSS